MPPQLTKQLVSEVEGRWFKTHSEKQKLISFDVFLNIKNNFEFKGNDVKGMLRAFNLEVKVAGDPQRRVKQTRTLDFCGGLSLSLKLPN